MDGYRISADLCKGPDAEHIVRLLEYCGGADAIAVDVPFGWPKPFAEALAGYRIGVPLDLPRQRYRLRTTDVWLKSKLPSLNPKSVSTDRLGSTAIVGTNLLHALNRNGFRLPLRKSGGCPAAIEVYPAASLLAWNLQALEREEIVRRLQEQFTLEISETTRSTLLDNDHCFDAFVAALTAREYAGGNTFYPPEYIPDETIEIEGWIHVPSRSLQ